MYLKSNKDLSFSYEDNDSVHPDAIPHCQGVCPHCGSSDLSYEGAEIDGSDVSYKWECLDCGTTGTEFYTMTFADHHNIAIGNGNDEDSDYEARGLNAKDGD